jgi:hypothetical protein
MTETDYYDTHSAFTLTRKNQNQYKLILATDSHTLLLPKRGHRLMNTDISSNIDSLVFISVSIRGKKALIFIRSTKYEIFLIGEC